MNIEDWSQRLKRATALKINAIYQHREHSNIYAIIREVKLNAPEEMPTILFSVWHNVSDKMGWQDGASLDNYTFVDTYPTQVDSIPGVEVVVEPSTDEMVIRITATLEYRVTPSKCQAAYKTTDPDEILRIDTENAWEAMLDAMQNSDDVKIKVERDPSE